MSAQTASDYERLRAQLERLSGVEDRTGLAESVLELVHEAISPELALVVFHHPEHGRPTVFGGTFEERRMVGRTLRRRAARDEDHGAAAIASAVGPSARVIRIGTADAYQGMMIVGTDTRALRADEVEYIQLLARYASENLRRLGMRSRIEELAAEVRASAGALEQQERLRLMGRMAEGVAADVEAALSPITAYSTMLLATEQNAETRRYVESIQQASADVAELVRSLRTFYPSGSEAAEERILVPHLVIEAIDATRWRWSEARRRDIRIDVDFENDLPAVPGNRERLGDAVSNLLFNAAQSFEGGPGTIRVTGRTERSSAGREEVVVAVEDDGCGMDAETLSRCTHLFFTTREEEGAGVGLSQVRRAARGAGGRLEIASEAGVGTRACIFLPTAGTERNGLRIVRDEEPEESGAPARILCIDDDAAVLRLLRTVFERDGHHVVTVTGGHAGVEAFVEGVQTSRRYDLVITDLKMPDLHGFAVIRALRATDADVPILMLTAWMQQLPEDLEDLDGLRVHSKPFDAVRVRLDIQDMLQRRDDGRMTGGDT